MCPFPEVPPVSEQAMSPSSSVANLSDLMELSPMSVLSEVRGCSYFGGARSGGFVPDCHSLTDVLYAQGDGGWIDIDAPEWDLPEPIRKNDECFDAPYFPLRVGCLLQS